MTLQLRKDDSAWKARLDLKFHYPGFKDESIEVSDLQIGDHRLSFRDPESWHGSEGEAESTGFDVHFDGVSTTAGELEGTAEISRPSDDTLLHWLGIWRLHRQSPQAQ